MMTLIMDMSLLGMTFSEHQRSSVHEPVGVVRVHLEEARVGQDGQDEDREGKADGHELLGVHPVLGIREEELQEPRTLGVWAAVPGCRPETVPIHQMRSQQT